MLPPPPIPSSAFFFRLLLLPATCHAASPTQRLIPTFRPSPRLSVLSDSPPSMGFPEQENEIAASNESCHKPTSYQCYGTHLRVACISTLAAQATPMHNSIGSIHRVAPAEAWLGC